jgi:hypothetical protein
VNKIHNPLLREKFEACKRTGYQGGFFSFIRAFYMANPGLFLVAGKHVTPLFISPVPDRASVPGPPDYVCRFPGCTVRCLSTTDLHSHVKAKHFKPVPSASPGPSSASPQPSRLFACLYVGCPVLCNSPASLQEHIKARHSKALSSAAAGPSSAPPSFSVFYACPFPGCTVRCTGRADLQSHIQARHSKVPTSAAAPSPSASGPSSAALAAPRPFFCAICNKQCKGELGLRYHNASGSHMLRSFAAMRIANPVPPSSKQEENGSGSGLIVSEASMLPHGIQTIQCGEMHKAVGEERGRACVCYRPA